nr:MAG TPA: hypothetical protein [Caudoviricetes sp.]
MLHSITIQFTFFIADQRHRIIPRIYRLNRSSNFLLQGVQTERNSDDFRIAMRFDTEHFDSFHDINLQIVHKYQSSCPLLRTPFATWALIGLVHSTRDRLRHSKYHRSVAEAAILTSLFCPCFDDIMSHVAQVDGVTGNTISFCDMVLDRTATVCLFFIVYANEVICLRQHLHVFAETPECLVRATRRIRNIGLDDLQLFVEDSLCNVVHL